MIGRRPAFVIAAYGRRSGVSRRAGGHRLSTVHDCASAKSNARTFSDRIASSPRSLAQPERPAPGKNRRPLEVSIQPWLSIAKWPNTYGSATRY